MVFILFHRFQKPNISHSFQKNLNLKYIQGSLKRTENGGFLTTVCSVKIILYDLNTESYDELGYSAFWLMKKLLMKKLIFSRSWFFSDFCLDFCFNGISESTKIFLHQNRSQSESNRLQSSTLRLVFYLISRKNRSHSDLGQIFYVHP